MSEMSRPSYQVYTIRRLAEMVESGHLDLNPDWQRGSVWTRDQRPRLIDSLDNGYPLPHITLWTRPQGRFVMVDGKQRTETIVGFVNDEFSVERGDTFSTRSATDQEAFLDLEIQALVFPSRIDEDFIVEYFERINSDSKQLSNGELINSLCLKPLVIEVNALFFDASPFQAKWSHVFGVPLRENKRMKYYEDTVPYLMSSLYGITYLTKSYPVIAGKLKETSEGHISLHKTMFLNQMDTFLGICEAIFARCPQLKPGWTKAGLPPLRQMSPIWVTILVDIVPDPTSFWTEFYSSLVNNEQIANQWALYMRKNGKPAQLYVEVEYAKTIVNGH